MKLFDFIYKFFAPVSFAEKKAHLDRLYNEMIENRRLSVYPPFVVKFANAARKNGKKGGRPKNKTTKKK